VAADAGRAGVHHAPAGGFASAGIVRWAHVSATAGDRPTASEIIAQLERLAQ